MERVLVEKYIKKLSNGKWGVFSSKGRKLGEHATRKDAISQLGAIEASKARRKQKSAWDGLGDLNDDELN